MTELVRLSGIRKNFAGVQALKGVDFDLKAGEVHALVGENGAGKSTLMRVLAGEIAPTSGTVSLNGEAVQLSGPRDATGRGISVIHQELALAPDLTVAENIFLGRLPGFVNHAALRKAAREILDRLGFSIDPAVQAGRLTVAHQQVVEIAKALSNKARIIVFDEPTAVLANSDAERLLAIIRELRANGTGVVYISHRLNEVFDLSDRITVMKDGSHVETLATSATDVDAVIARMVGRQMAALFPPKDGRAPGEVVVDARNLTRGRKVRDVSFTVRAGEVVGLGGLVGSGRTEVARLVFGADRMDSGTVELKGKPLHLSSPRQAVHAHIGLVPEDRKEQGVILDAPIRINTTLAKIRSVTRFGFLDVSKERKVATALGKDMRLKASSVDAPVSSLSGGNQQKVALAKWFHADCDLLILDEPTRGVDVGAKSEIYNLINDLAKAGKAVLVISSEHQELFGICDRILVMAEGAIVGELTEAAFTEQQLLTLAMTQTARARSETRDEASQ
ncbi:sugar ABC transporter ATP-binding protein [Shinella zoogloeoides]|uniref:sugar ABC transporter ATP-binding protein n=1 Tax=Shinella zoogloeoides TaxID=352475 RepID=UPI00299ED31E|nr:sugar ABC transporter ATP-binding protein [Shinella zoogloeoides]WPE21488.1 Galactose/methyl galactoside import ATP-binding protein MglA [Shinella zoogloeoides]